MAIVKEERIGGQRLILGDCLKVLDIITNNSVRMIWTDPPYGHNNADGDLLAAVNGGIFPGRKKLKEGNGAKAIANDGQEDMRRVVDGMLIHAARVLAKDSCCCCCCGGGGPRPTFAWIAQRMDTAGLDFNHSIIWDKLNPGLGWRYKRQHEMIMIAVRKNGRLAWSSEAKAVGNVFREFLPGQQRQHPNEKPIKLVQGFVERHTEKGEIVLDPFMGSGTTLVACQKMGRAGIGIELDPDYFAIACKRVDEATRQPDMLITPHIAPVQEAMPL